MGAEAETNGDAGREHEAEPERASDAAEPQETKNATSSVRFSIAKRKQVHSVSILKEENGVSTSLEYVSSIDASGAQIIGDGSSNRGTRVIPRLENTWKPEKRMKNLAAARGDEVKEFVNEILSSEAEEQVQYGLSVRNTSSGASDKQVQRDVLAARELRAKLDKQILDEHLSKLPEPATSFDYDQMPVEGFGHALMAGMGWVPGTGIGLRAKEDIVPTQYLSRPARLGLGAKPDASKEEKKKKYIKPGETRDKKPDLVAPVGPDGQIRSRISLDEKPVERQRDGVYGGKVMSIISGRHAGLRCEVSGKKDQVSLPGDKVSVKLKSGEMVVLDAGDLADVGSVEEERAMNRLKELRLDGRKKQDTDQTSRMDVDEKRPWLRTQIRVRIVSKSFEKGKLYLKKGIVVDVVAPTLCDVVLDETGKLYQRVKQEHLETVVPKTGGRIVVVEGKHRGSVGKLLAKDRDAETGTVQMEESFEMVTLSLDSISEFVGEMS